MPEFHGKNGKIIWSVANQFVVSGFVQSWSINADVAMADITAMQDVWSSSLPGIKSWTGSVDANLNTATTMSIALLGQTGTLSVYSATSAAGVKYVGDAICNGFNPSADVGDVGKISFTFVGVSALVQSALI